MEKGSVSVIGQEGLFNFPQLGCVNLTHWQHDYWNANEVDNYGEAIGQNDWLNCAKRKEAAEQFQLVKKRQKVSWKRLHCQDELHRSMTYNKFTTLTPGEEGRSSTKFYQVSQETCAKRKVNTKRNIDMLVKVRESPVGGCAKNSSEAQPARRRVSIAIDSGAGDSVISPEHVPDHEVHESLESRRGENFQSATREPIPNLGDLRLPLYTSEGTVRGMVMKASPVTKPSGSVKKICQAGHTVVFDDEGSLIMNKNTGEVNWLREEDGNYTLDAWTPPPLQGSNKASFHCRP